MELPELTKAEVLSIKPDDVLVFSAEARINEASKAVIREHLAKLFPANTVLILDAGCTLSIARNEEAV
jgi:DeoR/GlpR family transcriptional regulator of sugar metabolism